MVATLNRPTGHMGVYMSAILFAAIAMLNLSFINSLVVIAAIVVAAALIVAYMATTYRATPTIEWEPAATPIERPELDFLKSIKRCKDGVYMVSFEACGKLYHRRMPKSARTGKGGYAAFIKVRYAALFIEEAEATIEQEVVLDDAEPLSIGVKTPSIDGWEKMEASINRGEGEGNGWTYKSGLLTRYRGDGSYVRAWYRPGGPKFTLIGDWDVKDTGYYRHTWRTCSN